MNYSIYELVHKVILPWMPGYLAVKDSNLSALWHLSTSAKGRKRGTIVYDYVYGLRVRLDDPDLVKELRTLVLINNLENEVSIHFIDRRLPHD